MAKTKTFLEKYDIPLNHLEFAYVEACQNARELEKIVKILRSGEEGYFPDLTRCAEEKLKQLKPDSKLFRFEEQISRSNTLDKNELKPILEWTNTIKTKDNAMNELKQDIAELTANLPPMREPAKIDIDKKECETKSSEPATKNLNSNLKPINDQRIKSTDYSKWDKYDPDEEILRMDLQEERHKEQVQIKGRKIEETTKGEHIKICEQSAEEMRLQAQLKNLTQLEREQYSENCRLRGNECFKAKEYNNAINEYTRAIAYDPENAARSLNNRAISYIKSKNYLPAVEDCEACLQLEPNNIKALLRLADANYAQGRRREAYGIYQRVLSLEPKNANALKSLEELRLQLGELAPVHATRMIIEELQTETKKSNSKISEKTNNEKLKAQLKPPPPVKEYDLADLVKPNLVVKSKIISAAEALGDQLKDKHPKSSPQEPQEPLFLSESQAQPALRLPQTKNMSNKKLLIQEL